MIISNMATSQIFIWDNNTIAGEPGSRPPATGEAAVVLNCAMGGLISGCGL